MKSLISLALLKEQVKKSLPLMMVSIVFYLGLLIMLYGSSAVSGPHLALNLLGMDNPIMLAYKIFMTMAVVVSLFSYLFKPSTTTAMHSYPFSKNQLFFTNTLAGLIILIFPLLLFCIAFLTPIIVQEFLQDWGLFIPVNLFPNGINVGETINSFSQVSGFFMRSVFIIIFNFALFLFALMVSGHALIYVLVCLALLSIPSIISVMVDSIQTYFSFGYVPRSRGDLIIQAFRYVNPTMLGNMFHVLHMPVGVSLTAGELPVSGSNFASYLIRQIGIAIVLFGGAFYCNNKRQQEYAGHSIVFKPVNSVLIFFVSLTGMSFWAMLFSNIFRSMNGIYMSLIIGFIITYFISHMIAEQSFYIWRKAKKDFLKHVGILFAGFLFIIVFVFYDLRGFSTKSPAINQIQGVSLDRHLPHIDMTRLSKIEASVLENRFISNPEIIANVSALHNTIIQNQAVLRPVFLEVFSGQHIISDEEMQPQVININFKLYDGSILSRQYVLPAHFAEEHGVSDLIPEEYAIFAETDIFNIEHEFIRDMGVTMHRFNGRESIYISDIDEINSLIEVAKQDAILNRRNRDYRLFSDVDSITGIHIWITLDQNAGNRWFGTRINPSLHLSSFENVEAWLYDNGYID